MCIIWISLGARSVTASYLRQWLTHARDVWMSHVTMGYLFKCQSSQRVFCDHLNVSASTTWMSRTLFKWHSTYSNVCHLNEYSVIIWMSPPPPFKCHAPYLNVVHTLFKCDSSYSNEVHLIVRMSLNVHKVYVVFFFIGSFMGFFVLHMSVIRMSILCSSSECLSMCIVQVSVIWICITQVSVIGRSILNMSFLRYSLLHLECRFSNLHTQLII